VIHSQVAKSTGYVHGRLQFEVDGALYDARLKGVCESCCVVGFGD
jgi:hypothetical protein